MDTRAIAFAAILVGALFVVPGPADGDEVEGPRIELVAPNPVSAGNIGEFVVIDPGAEPHLGGWRLTDGYREAHLPDTPLRGPVVVSGSPSVTELLTDGPVIGWEGSLQLAADGDSLALLDPRGRVIDAVEYPRAPLDHQWIRIDDEIRSVPGEYRPLTFEPHYDGRIRPFVLPDSPSIPRETLADASDRLWLAGYELSDPAIRDLLRDRHAAGVDVRILVDGSPVGGQSDSEVQALDLLDDEGVPVRVIAGSRDRFRFHHPKYAVVDDRAIVMTENWKRGGTGGAASRGWGVVIDNPGPAADLATVFATDFFARDTVSWTWQRHRVSGRVAEPPAATYPPTFEPEPTSYDRLAVVVTPTSAESTLVAAIRRAEHRIDVQQVQISDPGFRLLEELIAAAERGVEVRLLLDAEWYVREDNQRLADELNAHAADQALPLEVRLVDPAGRFGKIHTKGMLIDDDLTVVGSMNWNDVSMLENREVITVIESAAVTAFFRETFEHDWKTPASSVPVGLAIATVTTWIVAGLLARQLLTFDGAV